MLLSDDRIQIPAAINIPVWMPAEKTQNMRTFSLLMNAGGHYPMTWRCQKKGKVCQNLFAAGFLKPPLLLAFEHGAYGLQMG